MLSLAAGGVVVTFPRIFEVGAEVGGDVPDEDAGVEWLLCQDMLYLLILEAYASDVPRENPVLRGEASVSAKVGVWFLLENIEQVSYDKFRNIAIQIISPLTKIAFLVTDALGIPEQRPGCRLQ
uniref:Uncharacterized protein n=1 Tax=Arundo donax TaxID=35708 RepID=A0A0A8ZYV7_ARUDO